MQDSLRVAIDESELRIWTGFVLLFSIGFFDLEIGGRLCECSTREIPASVLGFFRWVSDFDSSWTDHRQLVRNRLSLGLEAQINFIDVSALLFFFPLFLGLW